MMNTAPRRTNGTLVVGVDGSESALQATRWAAREAARRNASLVLVYTMNVAELYTSSTAAPLMADMQDTLRNEGAEILRAAEEAAKHTATVNVETHLEYDPPAITLRKASRGASLLVLGASGRGTVGTALGSVTLTLAGHAECPVVVIRGDTFEEGHQRPVVVGVDGSPLSGPALAYAFHASALRNAPLTAVHVWSDTDMQRAHLGRLFDMMPWEPMKDTEERALAERLAGWAERYPDITVERIVKQGNPHQALIELSQQAQLVVVATRGRGGFAGLLLGSTSLALVQHAACPVMLVGPESPYAAD